MEKNNLNLVEILKGYEGTELWTKTHGYLTLIEVDVDSLYPIILGKKEEPYIVLTSKGKYSVCHSDGECLVFPDKDDRDWKNFSRVMPVVGKTYTTKAPDPSGLAAIEAKIVYKFEKTHPSIDNKFLVVYTSKVTSEVIIVAWVDEKGRSIQNGRNYDLVEL